MNKRKNEKKEGKHEYARARSGPRLGTYSNLKRPRRTEIHLLLQLCPYKIGSSWKFLFFLARANEGAKTCKRDAGFIQHNRFCVVVLVVTFSA